MTSSTHVTPQLMPGELLTDEEAQKAVDMAISVVEAAHPLASLLPTKGIRETEDR
jgi:hypothetical protein